uniref:Uncharacterized protein n=1 Tax=Ascaris lumbricoides TaxID=6252 RepID=A0A0M3IPQ3_ASCLU
MCFRRGSGIISGLYIIITIESLTVGLVFDQSFEALIEYIRSKPENRAMQMVYFYAYCNRNNGSYFNYSLSLLCGTQS